MATFTSPDWPACSSSGEGQPAVALATPPPPPVVVSITTTRYPAANRGPGAGPSRWGLRVQLGGPWRANGDELLAVILDRPSDPRPTATLIGPEPLPSCCTGLAARHFPRAVTVFPDIDGRHTVVGHDVTFDAAVGCWTADIELEAAFTYQPYLRLTLAGYRPDAGADVALSAFVTTDPVRL